MKRRVLDLIRLEYCKRVLERTLLLSQLRRKGLGSAQVSLLARCLLGRKALPRRSLSRLLLAQTSRLFKISHYNNLSR